MKKIEHFAGQYKFLSNFEKCAVEYDGVIYNSVEAAYQAAKTLDHEARVPFVGYTPGEAKRAGQKLQLRPDWDTLRLKIMYMLVRQKFAFGPWRSKLLDTGNAELIEGNYWHDRWWGVHNGRGENHLGKILMRVREELQSMGGHGIGVVPQPSKLERTSSSLAARSMSIVPGCELDYPHTHELDGKITRRWK